MRLNRVPDMHTQAVQQTVETHSQSTPSTGRSSLRANAGLALILMLAIAGPVAAQETNADDDPFAIGGETPAVEAPSAPEAPAADDDPFADEDLGTGDGGAHPFEVVVVIAKAETDEDQNFLASPAGHRVGDLLDRARRIGNLANDLLVDISQHRRPGR